VPVDALWREVWEAFDALAAGPPARGKHAWERLTGRERLLWRACRAAVEAEAPEEPDALWARRDDAARRAFVRAEYGEAAWRPLFRLAACARTAVCARQRDVEGTLAWAQRAAAGLDGSSAPGPVASPGWPDGPLTPPAIADAGYAVLAAAGAEVGPARDLMLALLGAERPVARTLRVGVLGYHRRGFAASLVLELLPDGHGEFYPEPEAMAFRRLGGALCTALASAWDYARAQGPAPGASDLRWHLAGEVSGTRS
jgi:hypothetical protein